MFNPLIRDTLGPILLILRPWSPTCSGARRNYSSGTPERSVPSAFLRGRAFAAPNDLRAQFCSWVPKRLLLVVDRHVVELSTTGMRALLRESQRLAVF
jgi:hypothetical protein